uniref:26S proteasome non-ATPase regulatory subunit 13 n=2 Tax=Passeroidea TaxID=175121 RepID=A0A8C9UCA0_SERCA
MFFRQGGFACLKANAEGLVWVGKDLEDHAVMDRDTFHYPSLLHPGLGHFQGWISHRFSGHPVPGPQHPHREGCRSDGGFAWDVTQDPLGRLPSSELGTVRARSCPSQETIEEVEEMLNTLPGVTSVHSRFYDLSSKYYQTVGNHAAYYKDALRFLGCIEVKDLPVSEQQERAFTLGLAGLLGEGVYNFGELLMHPVLESLRSTDRQWLIDTLFAFNSGNVETFQALKSAWGQQPDLAANEALLLQKIQLLCLMEMTFTRPANHRQLTFEEIAKSAKVTVNEVELLVMKALSVGLVKGSIDEVDKRVHMTWVQPRVLDLQQIKGMKDRLEFWCTDVRSMEMLVEHQAHDILT